MIGPSFSDRALLILGGMRGLLRLRLGQEAEAQRDFDQCLRLKPALKESLESLVQVERLQLAAKR